MDSIDHGTARRPLPASLAAARAELAELEGIADAADAAYHGADDPDMPDEDYDDIIARRSLIAATFPELNAAPRPVGHPPAPGLRRVRHGAPMRSLENIYVLDEVEDFVARTRGAAGSAEVRYTSEVKIDGLSLSLLYPRGELTQAATRGDKVWGQDVTENAREIKDLPLSLPPGAPGNVEVRGEAYTTKADFIEINRRQAALGLAPHKSARSTAAGSLRCGDPAVTAARPVRFIAYQLICAPEDMPEDQEAVLALLRSWGFETQVNTASSDTAAGLMKAHALFETKRQELPFEIDGVVHKVSRFADREGDDETVRAPAWAVAHKFRALEMPTVVRDIVVQVGRTGALTPVAMVKPVLMGGVTVTRATLHNADHAASLDVRIGDTVVMARAGDVIPKIVSSGPTPGQARADRWATPRACPACGALAVREPDGARTRCSNVMSCGATTLARFTHLARKDVLDIDGLGEGKLESILLLGILQSPADLYRLHEHARKMKGAAGWGEKSADALLASIEMRRTVPLDRLLVSLQVREIGRTASRDIAGRFRTLARTLEVLHAAATEDQGAQASLADIPGIGKIMVAELVAWFTEPRNRAGLNDLLSEVDVVDLPVLAETAASRVSGLLVVFSGTLTSGSRDEAEARARARGAKTSSAVSAKTDLLVAGPGAGSKVTKAEALRKAGSRIETISEAEWLKRSS